MTSSLAFCAIGILSAAGASLLVAAPARAASFTVENITGTWTNVQGTVSFSGTGTNQVRWGNSATTGESTSGFNFDSVTIAAPLTSGTNFVLGELTHLNFPIFNPSSGADFELAMDVNGTAIAFDYSFAIEETTNGGTCPSFQISGTPCDDRITFSTDAAQALFSDGGIDYTLELLGFSATADGLSPVSSFITQENQASSAFLVARFAASEPIDAGDDPASTPEPASVLALLALSAAATKRRRRTI
ncbi:MAG: choice-of-anchor K domain-containing protein [Geitlerinemataceae cyanobacterium]|mgnify:CR=1 FL=1